MKNPIIIQSLNFKLKLKKKYSKNVDNFIEFSLKISINHLLKLFKKKKQHYPAPYSGHSIKSEKFPRSSPISHFNKQLEVYKLFITPLFQPLNACQPGVLQYNFQINCFSS